MGYIKANDILPDHLLKAIQEFVDGRCIYIPRRDDCRKAWGENSSSKEITAARNAEIFSGYTNGVSVKVLAEQYFLSDKAVYKIIGMEKRRIPGFCK
ncbi:CD3324 family protein [Breznakiella homolactica]|uniref:Mor transcription activator domain-containing protein n=1 Tax=Breznakiella homolactica TaxID=2798577 RepID=A0A7T7XPP6_9SPIR|nr:CD3324 family protein [Breznakiella homolactica]QQO10194.1 hypothetical protein JFL75_04535 [Breznakiella homolactica]